MNDSAFHFKTLLPDTIFGAIEQVGLEISSGLVPLNSYENRVYQFIDANQQRWVVKFYRPQRWSEEQILEEHAFSCQLHELEIPVVTPNFFQGRSLHAYAGIMYAVFPSVGGRQFEIDNVQQLEWVGRYLGRIHQLGYQSLFKHRPAINIDDYLAPAVQILLQTDLIPHDLLTSFTVKLNELVNVTKEYWRDDWQPCRLHGDCYPSNILWQEGPIFVDFDDARTGPVVQDMWMLLHGSRHEQGIQLERLLDAYCEYNDFNMQELSLIEPLRSMRMLHYLAWIVQRWQDAAFPKAFPWVLESYFWQRQITLFEEQIQLLQAPPLQLLSMF